MASSFSFLLALLAGLLSASPGAADFVLYSDPPESLLPGQNFTYDLTYHRLPFGPHVLSLGHDCNLVRYNLGERTWATNTSGEDCYLTLLPDGEVMLRNNFHYPLWRSGAKGSVSGSYAFMVAWDGALAVYGPELWSSPNPAEPGHPEPMLLTTDYVLYSQQVTAATYGLLVDYKDYRLVLTEDCNLVLEEFGVGDKPRVLWQTGTTSPYRDCFTQMDEYGELFIKHNRRDVLWRSGVRTEKPYVSQVLVLRYDGRLVIYKERIWYQPTGTPWPSAAASSRFSS